MTEERRIDDTDGMHERLAAQAALDAVPAIGAAWRPPQWTAFAISAVITCVAPIPAFATPLHGGTIGGIAAGAILALFVFAALWPAGRDD
ncbi:hypothetical protein [Microbacterium sp.]|uniref:hypothetical protein n=1 Tax=Microbacterium sp. TaxID=51671 RepID=UPI001AD3C19A|nr:hypothetical protein [Microbacterium sp.]MBN9156122.1 hypothetical protein [Microbacterium sp.]MBS1900978.1 hypothetical protein [Actinomycetota bacterium]